MHIPVVRMPRDACSGASSGTAMVILLLLPLFALQTTAFVITSIVEGSCCQDVDRVAAAATAIPTAVFALPAADCVCRPDEGSGCGSDGQLWQEAGAFRTHSEGVDRQAHNSFVPMKYFCQGYRV